MLGSFTKMSLRNKGIAIVAVAVISLVCTTVIARNAISGLTANLSNTADTSIPQLQEISQTLTLLQSAHLEVIRTSALANTGLTGEPMERQFAAAADALSAIQATYEFADLVEDGTVIAETKELVAQYLGSSAGALDMLSIEPMTGTLMISEADELFSQVVVIANETAHASKVEVNAAANAAIAAAGRSEWTFMLIAAASLVLCTLATFGIIQSITRPIQSMTRNMRSLAGGDLEVEIVGAEMDNEVGQMASALTVFRDNAIEAERLRAAREQARIDQARAEQEASDAKNAQAEIEADRITKDKEMADKRAAQSHTLEQQLGRVIDAAEEGNFSLRIEHDFGEKSLDDVKAGVNSLLSTVDAGLRAACGILQQLSDGNLCARMQGDFKGAFADLQKDTNLSAEQFEKAMMQITNSAAGVLSDASEISSSAANLSNRTEKTAASLEETSAAVEELTSSIQSAAKNAEKANDLVKSSMEKADESETVVRSAIAAMDDIAKFSEQISETINVINRIAFQTNLLALNAGVEAARAGESGRGFSVVASEVRALAVQAADSAQEIEQLIKRSSEQVDRGVGLVGRTGETIREMSLSINEATQHVSEIAQSAQQQAEGISSVNLAVSEIDKATQQNAAMFEETTAASHSLSGAAQALTNLAHQFRTSDRTEIEAAA